MPDLPKNKVHVVIFLGIATTVAHPNTSYGQTRLLRSVMGNVCGSASTANLTVNMTLGESIAGGATASTLTVESGFWRATSEVVTAVTGETTPISTCAQLGQNTPNPFNPRTSIEFMLPEAGEIELTIYDTAGRRIRTLLSGRSPAGATRVTWDGTDHLGRSVASGIYLCQLRLPSSSRVRKLALVR